MECPILVWMLSLNREVSPEEYEECYKLVQECLPNAAVRVRYDQGSAESLRQILGQMMPLLMMRHRRIPRAKWRDFVTPTGKHWIEQEPDPHHPAKHLYTMIGYNLSDENSILGMAMVQGRKQEVVNIGLAVKQLAVHPHDASVQEYVGSQSHKLTQLEMESMRTDEGDEVVLRRLCILLALKASYIKALGQPIGFDWSRIEFNVPDESATVDQKPLQGWEFRVFQSRLGVIRKGVLVEEAYQCVCSFYRGTRETKFIWHDTQTELEQWVQFITIDQMVKVIPKLYS